MVNVDGELLLDNDILCCTCDGSENENVSLDQRDVCSCGSIQLFYHQRILKFSNY